ncbi:oxygen-independent coproporphyrinogen-3 oxidase [Andreprevotia lacus DSM 23236]|uniref:Coproporphyrinogen-III oxidase n=1 Tax=Andreprevotia lacus DSM 23236 TaxID=1121001 RepID=A0A1W1XPJ4_9NEIS|nr:oxygen-independent coproporphyrinogen III oxidase [Andreprevotia lacus]SMC25775.1 oxygen-independent coproporphyrinogen-3 oxidase [Andreprevotia lacus DSM 23236]
MPNPHSTAQDVHAVDFDKALIARLAGNGPRYTSYPTADRFSNGFDQTQFLSETQRRFSAEQVRPLSLYVHIPFCDTVCFYCGCNKVITANRSHAARYLDYLEREIALQAPLFTGRARVEQLHFGGGTPTYFTDQQLTRLMASLREHFAFTPATEGEFSIEIDPRKVGSETVAQLAALGFNRMSVGVQDFDPVVQHAVNRIQSEAETVAVIEEARSCGFKSVSIDLIYGLPRQTLGGFAATLDKVIAIRPDRLSVYNYAHMPHLFKTQRQINAAELPSPDTRLDLLSLAIRRLTNAGYVYIGMDHFALPDDELAHAQRKGTLQRNFQGYSTRDDIDLLALGVSAISKIGGSYSQNVRDLGSYYAQLDAGELPLLRGIALSRDDLLRRSVIQQLMCHFHLDLQQLSTEWQIDARSYFAEEWQALSMLADDGLLVLDDALLQVLPRGRLLIRNIAMQFDRHLRESKVMSQAPPLQRYSQTI